MDEKRYKLIESNLGEIIDKAEIEKYKLDIPIYRDKKIIFEIILNHAKKYNRVIYGGYAQDFWLKKKTKKGIYGEMTAGDVDMKSPDPIFDIVEICNQIYKKGFTSILGKQSILEGVFNIVVEGEMVADISYISPKALENHLLYKKEGGFSYVDYRFIIGDMYFIFSKHHYDYKKFLEKSFKRFYLITKNYPEIYKKPKNITKKKEENKNIIKYKQTVFDKYIVNNKNIIVTGEEAYKYYVELSGYSKTVFKPSSNEPLVIIVDDLKKETEKIIKILNLKNIKLEEYNRYLYNFDKSIVIKYDGDPIIRIYGNLDLCTQFNTIELDNKKDTVKISSYSFMMYYLTYMMSYYKKEKEEFNKYNLMFYYLHLVHNHYLDKNNLTGMETDNPFTYFRLDCIWEKRSVLYTRQMYFNKRYQDKQRVKFEYRPESKYFKKININFPYKENSGERILDKKRLIFKESRYHDKKIKN